MDAVYGVLGRARFRIRAQGALEGATTATIVSVVIAMAAIFAIRAEWISGGTGIGIIAGAGALIAVGAILGASRKLDDEAVARRIDRASNLSDRLSTAIAFHRSLTGSASDTSDGETHDLMIAAIKDGARAVPRANIEAATPFAVPKDLRAAFGFLVVSALVAGLALPTVDRTPHLFSASPDHGPPGTQVLIKGKNLMAHIARPVASTAQGAGSTMGVPNVPAEAVAKPAKQTAREKGSELGFQPTNAVAYLGSADQLRPIAIVDWTGESISVAIPADAKVGDTKIHIFVDQKTIGDVSFTVVDPKDTKYHDENAVVLTPDDRAYVESILAELKNIAQRDKVPELEDFAKKIQQLLEDAEQGKISKEQLLAALEEAEKALSQKAEPNQAELDKQMAEMGKELAKDKLTKELGEAFQKNDLEKAKQELEKLAQKVDKNELEKAKEEAKKELEKKLADKSTPEKEKQELQKKLDELKQDKPLTQKEKEQLGKKLEEAAKQLEKQNEKQDKQAKADQKKVEDEIRRLEKQKEQAKNDKERQDTERRLDKKKDELRKLQKDEKDKQQSAQREAVKRLQRDMEKASENLQKPQKGDQQEQEQQDQQSSQKLKDAARETGKVDQDQRKQASQKKNSSQMDDLREAMRRAKQKGNKGPNDPFNKQAKNQDFGQRARGQKGQGGQSWKPGQGQQPGQGQGGQPGQGQPGGPGQQPGGSQWGVGHDDNLTGDATGKTGNTKDQDLQGKAGTGGSSKRETILAAAQKGFSSVSYKKVYADYQRVVEEVMRTEKLPSSYKYYVKRYFAKIHPNSEPASEPVPAPQGNTK
ncbi:MAG: hypothetical protein H0T79_07340 [Deltaproteobacteria bacterium]|nr:hypothetical protein [Deltaproteobacteria bacterium]